MALLDTNHCLYNGFYRNIHFVLQIINLQKTSAMQPHKWEHATEKNIFETMSSIAWVLDDIKEDVSIYSEVW